MSEKKKPEKRAAKPRKPAQEKMEIERGALDDAPMIGAETNSAVLGTLSQASAAEETPRAEKPKRPVRKQERAEQPDAPVESDAAEQPAAPAPGVLSAEAAPGVLSAEAAPGVLSAEAAPEAEPLKLPRGGFIAFRKSGGIHFSTREVVVYPDGRVAYDARGVPQKEYNRLRRALNDAQIISLRKLLDQTNFWKAESGGQQNPDAFAYEIAARLGTRSNEVQVFDGSVPENLKPLIERLTKLLPE